MGLSGSILNYRRFLLGCGLTARGTLPRSVTPVAVIAILRRFAPACAIRSGQLSRRRVRRRLFDLHGIGAVDFHLIAIDLSLAVPFSYLALDYQVIPLLPERFGAFIDIGPGDHLDTAADIFKRGADEWFMGFSERGHGGSYLAGNGDALAGHL